MKAFLGAVGLMALLPLCVLFVSLSKGHEQDPVAPLSVAPDAPASRAAVLERPEAVQAVQREAVPSPAVEQVFTAVGVDAPKPDPDALQRISTLRGRVESLEALLAEAQRALDECRNGPFSALGSASALPEWAELDRAGRINVTAFLTQFPIQLGVGEAKLIATYVSPTFDTKADLVRMLGRDRVLRSMSVEARTKLQTDDPEEFAELFGPVPP